MGLTSGSGVPSADNRLVTRPAAAAFALPKRDSISPRPVAQLEEGPSALAASLAFQAAGEQDENLHPAGLGC